jgi:hypothetical protein
MDGQVERVGVVDLEPARAAAPGFVRRVEVLGHHALVAGGQRRGEKGFGRGDLAGDEPRYQQVRRQRRGQRGEALARRLRGQVGAVQVQAVEEVDRQRQLGTEPLDVELAAETAHRHLERLRCAARAEHDRLAVDDQLARCERTHRIDQLRHGRGHVVEVARVDAHLVAGLVHLHARAVELPFERGRAERGERRSHVVGRRGQHRLHRLQQADREAGEPGRAVAERRCGDSLEPARDHRGAAHLGGRQRARGGDRVEHHAFERALAQLADDQAHEEVALGGVGAREQRLELLRPRRRARRHATRRSRDRACPGAARR